MNKIRLIVLLSIFFILITSFFIKKNIFQLKIKPIFQNKTTINTNTEPNDYQAKLDNIELLSSYFSGNQKISFKNNSNKNITINVDKLFYSFKKISDQIGIRHLDSDQTKADKIFNFVKKLNFKLPLYKASETSLNAPFLYSTFGFGNCGTSTILLCGFSKIYNLNCRFWDLGGHAVSEIFYGNKWHLYDPTSNGTLIKDGQVQDINYAIELAKNNQLKFYNQEYATTENNRLFFPAYQDVFEVSKPINFDFFPNETKYFFDNNFIQKNLSTNPNRQYNRLLSNFIREIPLNQYKSINNLTISDYFPIVDAFIITDKDYHLKTQDLPNLTYKNDDQNSTYQAKTYSIDNHFIIDLSFQAETKQDKPIFSININNINKLHKLDPNLKIITANFYSVKYIDLSKSNLEYLTKNKIDYKLNQND
jgi:hypothetical protein